MARSSDLEREIWGTWEELLLACAVNRHGTRSWDSVALEVQARSPFSHHLTPQGCRQRYGDLQRRFAAGVDGLEDDGASAAGDGSFAAAEIPWLEELRKLRVAELRREVERYDLSIVSLQLKVSRLREERERSLRETEYGEREDDLKDDEKKASGSPGSTPGPLAGARISGGDSGRSCEESNSTDPKEEEEKPRREDGNPEEEEAGSGGGQADLTAGGAEKTTGEGSYNGSSDTIAKGAAAVAAEADLPQPQTGESGESVAESKGGEAEGGRESSDVQSSASLSRRRTKAVSGTSGGGGGGEEHEADEDSLIAKRIAAESQPLVSFLEIIRSNEYGSIFEHRLESQENGRYRSVIRQHVDLEMMRAKLEHGGGRLYTSVEFFRDLLLLCNNAIVFYPTSSSESTAAVHLRQLVAKEMATSIRKPARPPTAVESAPPSLPPQPPEPKFKEDPDMASSLFEQPTSSIPMITCRKRSSISTKAKEERDEKHDSARKERESEEQNLSAKKTINERSATRGVRTNKSRNGNRTGGGGGAAAGKSLNSSSSPSHKSKPLEITAAEQVRKVEKKSGGGAALTSLEKKRSAASFLKRMKRSSLSSNGTLLEKLKGTSSVGGGRAAEQKKGGKGDDRKDQGSRRGGGATHSKKAPEPSAPAKRSVGRPPKRAAAPPTPPPAKRRREEAEPASVRAPPASSRKRGRR